MELGESYGMSGMEPEWVTCKASTLCAVLLLGDFPVNIIFVMKGPWESALWLSVSTSPANDASLNPWNPKYELAGNHDVCDLGITCHFWPFQLPTMVPS